MEFLMHVFILLVVFILVFTNIVRVIIKEARKMEGGSGKGASGGENLLNVLSSQARNEAWMEVAGTLDLQYVRPARLRARPSLRGMVKDFVTETHIEYSSSGSLATVCSVQFPEKLGIGLLIIRDDATVVAEELADRKMLRVTALDGLDVRCSANNAEVLKSFLTPMRVNVLKNALSFYRTLRVTDDYVVLKLAGECRDADHLTNFIEFTVSLASALQKNSASETLSTKGFQEFAQGDEEDDLPGIKTVMEPSSAAAAVPEFRQPKTILTPIKPVTDDAELLQPDESVLPTGPAEEHQTASAKSRMPEVKPVSSPVFSTSRMPEVKPVSSPVFSTSRMPEVKPASSAPVSSTRPASYGKEPEKVQENAASPSDSLLDQNALAAALFSSSFPGQKEQELFSRVKGKKIEWSGELKSSYQFGNDFVLGNGPAVKAVFEIAEISGTYSMKTKVKAVVRLPLESLERLKNRNGEHFRFSGLLAKLETFAREIVIFNGSLKD